MNFTVASVRVALGQRGQFIYVRHRPWVRSMGGKIVGGD